MSNTQQKQILERFIEEVWNKGKFSHLDQFITSKYSVTHDPYDPWGGQTIDRDVFKERVLYSRDAFPDLNFEIQDMISEDGKVAVCWIMSGTHQGDLPQIPATGRKFAISGMTFYWFDGDKLEGHSQNFDQLGFLTQIGAFGLGGDA